MPSLNTHSSPIRSRPNTQCWWSRRSVSSSECRWPLNPTFPPSKANKSMENELMEMAVNLNRIYQWTWQWNTKYRYTFWIMNGHRNAGRNRPKLFLNREISNKTEAGNIWLPPTGNRNRQPPISDKYFYFAFIDSFYTSKLNLRKKETFKTVKIAQNIQTISLLTFSIRSFRIECCVFLFYCFYCLPLSN